MRLETIEVLSTPGSGLVNEDRAGAAATLAWMIDGATDVLPAPLVGEITDAAWFAAEMDHAIRKRSAGAPLALADLPTQLAAELSEKFAAAQRREPSGNADHPSAAAIVVQVSGNELEYVTLGDCALFAHDGRNLHHVGDDAARAGDRWVADAIAGERNRNPGSSAADARKTLWVKLGGARSRMNSPDGYGIFSITHPPARFVRTGRLALPPGATVLLVTDGLTRLIDVFGRYDAASFFETAASRGLAVLEAELRALEAADPDGVRFPRAKTHDDATGLLLRLA